MKLLFSRTTYDTDEGDSLTKNITAEQRLMEDLRKTRIELEIAYSGFDNVIDPDLIDCYIYKVNAVLKRYKFLTEKAAELHLPPEKIP